VPVDGIYDVNAAVTIAVASGAASGTSLLTSGALGINIAIGNNPITQYWQNQTNGLGAPNITNQMQFYLPKGSTNSIAFSFPNNNYVVQAGSSLFGVYLKQRTSTN
jgi:hypothetical protein